MERPNKTLQYNLIHGHWENPDKLEEAEIQLGVCYSFIDFIESQLEEVLQENKELQSQLKERDEIIEKKQTIIDMQSETINRAVDIFAAFENELTSKTKQDEPEII